MSYRQNDSDGEEGTYTNARLPSSVTQRGILYPGLPLSEAESQQEEEEQEERQSIPGVEEQQTSIPSIHTPYTTTDNRNRHHPRFDNPEYADVPDDLTLWANDSLKAWIKTGVREEELWGLFREDFGRWTAEEINQLDKALRIALRQFLRNNGVRVNGGLSVTHGLIQILEETPLGERPTQSRQPETIETAANRRQVVRKPVTQPPITPITGVPARTVPVPTVEREESYIPQAQRAQIILQAQREAQRQAQRQASTPHRPGLRPLYLGRQTTQPGDYAFDKTQATRGWRSPGPYERLPPPGELPDERYKERKQRALGGLLKMYPESQKYSGPEDVLESKLKVFYDLCPKAGVIDEWFGDALSTMLKSEASKHYYRNVAGRGMSFIDMIEAIRMHFETEERQEMITGRWEDLDLIGIQHANPGKPILECFELMRGKLLDMQEVLLPEMQTELNLRNKLYRAIDGIPECALAIMKKAPSFEGACYDIRSSISQSHKTKQSRAFVTSNHQSNDRPTSYSNGNGHRDELASDNEPSDVMFTDRKILYNDDKGRRPYRGSSSGSNYRSKLKFSARTSNGAKDKACFICKKVGCWSTQHPEHEQKAQREKWRDKGYEDKKLSQFILQIEGLDPDAEFGQFVNDFEDDSDDGQQANENHSPTVFVTDSFGDVDGEQIFQELQNQSTTHAITNFLISPETILSEKEAKRVTDTSVFLSDRYSRGVFRGILIDTGAAVRSTAGHQQFKALAQIMDVKLDDARAGEANIRFGIGQATSIGTVDVKTPIGTVTFHVLPADTPFLLSLKDLDDHKVRFDNLENKLIQGEKQIPVVRAWGHPWMLLDPVKAMAYHDDTIVDRHTVCHLTELELRQVHRRFGHPSARRLISLLHQAGHHENRAEVERLTRYCEYCQKHARKPMRFKFTIRDDKEFNHTVFIDVLWLDSKPVLQLVDEATGFQAARFLTNESSECIWNTTKEMWMDTYLGPPDWFISDAGKNVTSKEWRTNARIMGSSTKAVPVEAHHSIGLVERYHVPLRRAYEILSAECPTLSRQQRLQAAVKAVNDTAGPNGLVPTLLVFGAYPRLTEYDPPAASITQRAAAIAKAMQDVRKCHAARKLADALRMRNGPTNTLTGDLPLNSDVLVWREREGWKGPFKMVGMDGHSCQIQLPHGVSSFRVTSVKPYLTEQEEEGEGTDPAELIDKEKLPDEDNDEHGAAQDQGNPPTQAAQPVVEIPAYRPNPNDNIIYGLFTSPQATIQAVEAFLTEKEERDQKASRDLRTKGVITTPGSPFALSRRTEIDGLLARGVFEIIPKEAAGNVRIFGSRMVDEVKGKETSTPYEKSRLVIQAFNDEGKKTILTQSPTIQRASQRMIVAIYPSLREQNVELWLRDITQAYIQSTSKLSRPVFAYPPKDMQNDLPPGVIFKVILPLYGIPEAGTHWFSTYHKVPESPIGRPPIGLADRLQSNPVVCIT